MEFTQAQKQAIQHGQGPCLVLAVPGAGKTTVLLHRLLALIEEGVSPKSIVSLTFSRKQALDMRERFLSMRSDARGLTFSTIHAFCYRIVMSWSKTQDQELKLLEGSGPWQQARLIRQLYRPYRKRPLDDDEIDDFFRIDGYLKNTLTSYRDYQKKTGEHFPHFEELAHDYMAFKSDQHLIDFDDMLLLTLQIFDRNPFILAALQKRFQYIQVDEAQDTSLLQLRIIQKIAQPENNLFMVADDDQAIYSFRGASPAYLLQFKELYPDARLITMEDNYRSSKRIVKVAGDFIRHNTNRYAKLPNTEKEDPNKIRILLAADLKKELQSLVQETPEDLKRGNLAILFRNNLSMIALADRLDRAGIAFQSRARGDRFFNHFILKDLLAILRFADDPRDLDTFASIYYKLNAYLKKDFIAQIARMDSELPVLTRLRQLDGTKNPFYRDHLNRLNQQFSIIRKLPTQQALEQIDLHLGYGEYLKEKSRSQGRSVSTSMRIMETAKCIADGLPSRASFERRLEELPLLLKKSAESQSDCTLSTVHGAKGLEYDTVAIMDLIQEEFPSTAAIQAAEEGKDFLMEEERRLFYVAMTRAKSQLKLYGRKSVNGRKVELSQFIRELREE